MGMFGSTSPYDDQGGPVIAAPASDAPVLQTQPAQLPTFSQSAPAAPPPSLFGAGAGGDRWAMTLAGLRDALDPLTSNPTGGGNLDRLKQQQLQMQSQKARRDAFTAAYDPATGKFDPKKFISGLAGGGVTPSDDDVKTYLTPQKPVDIGGAGYSLNNDTGKYEQVIAPKVAKEKPFSVSGIGLYDPEAKKFIALEPGVTPQQAAAAQPQAQAQQPAPAATPAPSGPVYDQIAQAAAAHGGSPQDVAYAQRLAQVESGGNPSAVNGSSSGLFGFHPDTLAANGGGQDVPSQTAAALKLAGSSRQALQAAGLPATDANAYILHQQGAGGGMALLQADPSTPAVQALAPSYKNSPSMAVRAIAGNIGLPYKTPEQQAAANAIAQQMTAGQFSSMWQARWNGATPTQARQAALAAPAPAAGPTAAPAPAAPDPNAPMTFSKASGHPSTATELTSVGLKPGTPAWTGLDGKPVPYPASETGQGDDDVPLTPQAVDLQAGMYLKDRSLPPLGMGKAAAANRSKILNRATEIAQSLGLDASDIMSGAMGVKAAGAALNKATTMRSQIEGNEQTVIKNADFALTLAPKGGGPTNVPVLNRFVQHVRGQYAGDPDVSAFNNAIGTVADEYAKVMTATTGSGGTTSDSARNEAYKRLSSSATLPQLRSNIAAMKTEMANRVNSMRDVETGLRAQVRNGGVAPAPATPAPAAPPSPGGWGQAVVVKR